MKEEIKNYVEQLVKTAFEIRMEDRDKYKKITLENLWNYCINKQEDPIQYIQFFERRWAELKPHIYRSLKEAEQTFNKLLNF
jgi:uncharacterized protein YbdZ (MbtH family)